MGRRVLVLVCVLMVSLSAACQTEVIEVTRIVFSEEGPKATTAPLQETTEPPQTSEVRGDEADPELEPSPTPVSTPESGEEGTESLPGSGRNVPKILVLSESIFEDPLYELTKLQGVALESGIKLAAEGSHEEFDGILAFSGWGGDNAPIRTLGGGDLYDIVQFVRSGGRAVVFITPVWSADFNSAMGDLFFLTISREVIGWGESLIFEGSDLLPLWDGLTVGATTFEKWETRMMSYLSGQVEQGYITTIDGEGSSQSRVSSILLDEGAGELLLAQTTCSDGGGNSCRFSGNFLSDEQIDRLDNEEAGRRVLEWLTDRSPTQIGSSSPTEPPTVATPTSTIPPPPSPVAYTEEFDSVELFSQTSPDVYISDGKVFWNVKRDGGVQYVFREITPFSGDVQLTVRGQIDGWTNNCRVRAGIGSGLQEVGEPPSESGLSLDFVYHGGGCSAGGAAVRASGVSLDHYEENCDFHGNWLWIEKGVPYTADLTVSDGVATLSVPGIGETSGDPVYDGIYDTLFVGMTGGGDWPECHGTIDSIMVRSLE